MRLQLFQFDAMIAAVSAIVFKIFFVFCQIYTMIDVARPTPFFV